MFLSYKVMAQVILNEVKFSQQFLLSKVTVNTLELLIFFNLSVSLMVVCHCLLLICPIR